MHAARIRTGPGAWQWFHRGHQALLRKGFQVLRPARPHAHQAPHKTAPTIDAKQPPWCASSGRLEEAGLAGQAEAAIGRYARDDTVAVKVAAAAAAGGLAAGQLRDHGRTAALPGLVPAVVGLLGPDQPSEVQRAGLQVRKQHDLHKLRVAQGLVGGSCPAQLSWPLHACAHRSCKTAGWQVPLLIALGMDTLRRDRLKGCLLCGPQVLRRVAAVDAAALAPHLSEVVSLVAALASGGAGPTRLAAERAAAASLRLNVDIAIAQVPACLPAGPPACIIVAGVFPRTSEKAWMLSGAPLRGAPVTA